jgi:hypothetical protein
VRIILLGVIMMALLATSCGYKVLANKLDFESEDSHISISPCKVRITKDSVINLSVNNLSDKDKEYSIYIRQPDKLNEGYVSAYESQLLSITADITEFAIDAGGSQNIKVGIEGVKKISDQEEAWISIIEKGGQINHEVILKILVN